MSQPPHSGPPSPDHPSSGSPYDGTPYPGRPNPDVPSSMPPQPGFPPSAYEPPPSYDQPPAAFDPPPSYGQPPAAFDPPPSYGQPPAAFDAHPSYDQAPAAYGPPPSYDQAPAAYGPPPEYGQPPAAYGQPPEYGRQPAYGPPPVYGPPSTPPSARRSRVLPIVLISLAVLLVLCVGGGVAIYLAARNTVNGIADSVADRPSTRPPTATTEATPRRTISVVEPSKLNGRPKLTNPQFADVAEDLETAFGQLPGAGQTVSALYGTPAERDVVVIAAAEADVADPARMLSGTFLGAGVGGMEVTGLQTVDAGPLGGTAKCGTVDETDLELIMCGWADEGSVGWVLWYFESMNKAKAEFPKLRGQIEKAS